MSRGQGGRGPTKKGKRKQNDGSSYKKEEKRKTADNLLFFYPVLKIAFLFCFGIVFACSIFIGNGADLSYLFNPVLRLTNTESGTYLRCLNLKAAPGKQEIIGIIQD